MELITWYIVFSDFDIKKYWWNSMLKEGFKHCYCFRVIEPCIFYVNSSISNIDSKIVMSEDVTNLYYRIKSTDKNAKVVAFNYKFDFNNRLFRIWNCIPSCVSIVKMFLGVSTKAVTPYQLYKYIMANGAIEINQLNINNYGRQ